MCNHETPEQEHDGGVNQPHLRNANPVVRSGHNLPEKALVAVGQSVKRQANDHLDSSQDIDRGVGELLQRVVRHVQRAFLAQEQVEPQRLAQMFPILLFL